MAVPFNAESKLLNEIFGRDVSYLIPEYQRPYSWECVGKSDRNNQVNVMWDDLYNYFVNTNNHGDYFFGSIVLINKNGSPTYEVIDGQQRLTTTLLLFSAIKSFLKDIKPNVLDSQIIGFIEGATSLVNEIIYNKKLVGAVPIEKKLKVEKSSEFDYDQILDAVVDDATFVPKDLFDQANEEQKVVMRRYINNHDYFKGKIAESFSAKGKFGIEEATGLNNFIEFLKNKVSVVRILADGFDIAYHVFEILNNRGLPLSNKDLFRNFIIKEFDKLKKINRSYSSINPGKKWGELENNFDITTEFISRWVETYSASQPRGSAFNELKEIYNKDYRDSLKEKKIEIFYNDIARDLSYYSSIVNGNFADPIIKGKVNFILHAPNVRYGVNFLLALSKYLNGLDKNVDVAKHFLIEYERFMLYSLLVTRFNYGVVYRAIAFLNKGDSNSALNEFSVYYNVNDIVAWIRRDILENETAKLLLAKYIWITDSKIPFDVVEQRVIFESATLEHIIPQLPDENSNWVQDFSPEFRTQYTYRLGNMTLVTSKLNSAMKNFDFQKKKQKYAETNLVLTRSLASLAYITEGEILERHEKIVNTILSDVGIDA